MLTTDEQLYGMVRRTGFADPLHGPGW